MSAFPTLPEQDARLATLRRLGVLDASANAGLNALARAAASAVQAPIAIVTLANLESRWLNAPLSDGACVAGECAFGAHVAREQKTLAVEDARLDERFKDHPWVREAPFMVSYLGAPTMISSGFAVGALNVVDTRPRVWTEAETRIVQNLARVAATLLETRTVTSAMDVALDGLAITDPMGVFTYMNKAHALQFGYDSADELIGCSWRVLSDPTQEERIAGEAFPEVARSGSWAGEVIGLRRDRSTFHQEITLTALPTGGIICATRDITQRRALEAEALRQTDMRARAEAANAAKTTFFAQLSHEIRTPLNGVLGLASALARTPLDAKQREILALLQSSGQTLDRLLADILDLSKVEVGKMTLQMAPFDLRAVVRETVELARLQASEKGIALTLDNLPENAASMFLGDATRFKQLLLNLITNAIKFTDAGTVSVRLTAEPQAGADDAIVTLEVEDTGIGFDAETGARIFERFEQADSAVAGAYGGAGLGLAICEALAEAMQGRISARSEPGVGSVFTVVAPMARAGALAPLADGRASAAAAKFRVLVAEDHAINRKVLALILEATGAEITYATDGQGAVDACRQGRFDLVLMDFLMPGMDGAAAIREIRRHEAELGRLPMPIAMVSASVLERHRAEALAAGADHFVIKPLTARSLLAGIEATFASCAHGNATRLSAHNAA